MIPRIIHFCWFGSDGSGDKPLMVQKCIESWKKYCPDYEIKEWNEANYDVTQSAYMQEAYEAKKWAFVSDYARLDLIYRYGGIYLDTDVELIKPLDEFLKYTAFFASEDNEYIATGLGFGAEKGNHIVRLMLDGYENVHFMKPDGSYDLTACPVRNTASIKHLLPTAMDDAVYEMEENSYAFPPEYFCPLSTSGIMTKKTANTVSIHHFSASWLSEEEQIVHRYRLLHNKCTHLFGETIGHLLVRFVYLFKPKELKTVRNH